MSQGFGLQGRRVPIAGAASGVGAATARVCAGRGAETILVDMEDAAPRALPGAHSHLARAALPGLAARGVLANGVARLRSEPR